MASLAEQIAELRGSEHLGDRFIARNGVGHLWLIHPDSSQQPFDPENDWAICGVLLEELLEEFGAEVTFYDIEVALDEPASSPILKRAICLAWIAMKREQESKKTPTRHTYYKGKHVTVCEGCEFDRKEAENE